MTQMYKNPPGWVAPGPAVPNQEAFSLLAQELHVLLGQMHLIFD